VSDIFLSQGCRYTVYGEYTAIKEILSDILTMLLQFISEPTIGARERRLIRSHVMKGKNAGKPRQPKAQLIHKGSAESTGSSEEDVSENLKMRAKHKSLLYQVYWNELSSTSYPCEIGPETERFVYQRTSLDPQIVP
jgi:hypothetical protein